MACTGTHAKASAMLQRPSILLSGDADKHLNLVLSIHRQPHAQPQSATITVTTVVHVNMPAGQPLHVAHQVHAPLDWTGDFGAHWAVSLNGLTIVCTALQVRCKH